MNWSTTYMRTVSVIAAMALAAVTLIAVVTTSALAQDEIVLNFLEEKLSLKPDEKNQFIGPVTVHNTSAAEVSGLSFKATLYISDTVPFNGGKPIVMVVTKSVYCPDNECMLPGSEVGQFVLQLPPQDSDKKLSGYLWLDTPAGVRAEVLPLTVTPKPAGNAWEERLSDLFTPGSTQVPLIASMFALVTALGILVHIGWFAMRKRVGESGKNWHLTVTAIIALVHIGWSAMRKSVGQVGWDFSKNWLSNVTAITALTGSITGLFTFDSAQILTKNEKFSEYTFLFALFGLMVIVAPLIGKMLSALRPAGKLRDETRAWVYVLTVAVVIWAAIGVLITAVLFIAEGLFAGNISNPTAIFIILVALALVLLTCFYSYKKTTAFACETTQLVERQDAVATLLNNVKPVRAVDANSPPIVDIEKKLTTDVDKAVLGAIAGFDPPGNSVLTALDNAIQRLQDPAHADHTKAILDALKVGLEAVLAVLKPSEDGRYQPTVVEKEAVTNLNEVVTSASKGTTPSQMLGILSYGQLLSEAIVVPMPTAAPPGGIRPKVYLP